MSRPQLNNNTGKDSTILAAAPRSQSPSLSPESATVEVDNIDSQSSGGREEGSTERQLHDHGIETKTDRPTRPMIQCEPERAATSDALRA